MFQDFFTIQNLVHPHSQIKGELVTYLIKIAMRYCVLQSVSDYSTLIFRSCEQPPYIAISDWLNNRLTDRPT